MCTDWDHAKPTQLNKPRPRTFIRPHFQRNLTIWPWHRHCHAIAESSWNAADILVEQVWRWLSKRQGDNYKNGNNQPESAGGKRKVFYLVFLKIIVDGKIKLLTDQRCLSLPSPGPRFDRRPCLDTSHSWK